MNTIDFAALTARLDAKAEAVADLCGANQSEREGIMRLSRLVRHGHKLADLHVRKDGKEYTFEADWLCRLFRSHTPDLPTQQRG